MQLYLILSVTKLEKLFDKQIEKEKKEMEMEKMTETDYRSFRQIYDELSGRSSVKTPKQEFIDRICSVTMKSPSTVRCWLAGAFAPDELTKSVLSKELGVPGECLFPNSSAQ